MKKTTLIVVVLSVVQVSQLTNLTCRCELSDLTDSTNDILVANVTYDLPHNDPYNISQSINVNYWNGTELVKTKQHLCVYLTDESGMTVYSNPDDTTKNVESVIREIKTNEGVPHDDLTQSELLCTMGMCRDRKGSFKEANRGIRNLNSILTLKVNLTKAGVPNERSLMDKVNQQLMTSNHIPNMGHSSLLAQDYLFSRPDERMEDIMFPSGEHRRRRSLESETSREIRAWRIRRLIKKIVGRLEKYEVMWLENYTLFLVYLRQSPHFDSSACVLHPLFSDLLKCYSANLHVMNNTKHGVDAMKYFAECVHIKYSHKMEQFMKNYLRRDLLSL